MNRRSFFRALLGAPLAVPAVAAASAKPAPTGPFRYRDICTTGESGSEAVMPLTRFYATPGERIDITVHASDPDAFMRNLPQMKEQRRRVVKQAGRAR